MSVFAIDVDNYFALPFLLLFVGGYYWAGFSTLIQEYRDRLRAAAPAAPPWKPPADRIARDTAQADDQSSFGSGSIWPQTESPVAPESLRHSALACDKLKQFGDDLPWKGRRYMTLCVGTLCDDRKTIVLVADRMFGIGGWAEAELNIRKATAIHKDWMVMIAGNDVAPPST